jgi:hypothetical protein
VDVSRQHAHPNNKAHFHELACIPTVAEFLSSLFWSLEAVNQQWVCCPLRRFGFSSMLFSLASVGLWPFFQWVRIDLIYWAWVGGGGDEEARGGATSESKLTSSSLLKLKFASLGFGPLDSAEVKQIW